MACAWLGWLFGEQKKCICWRYYKAIAREFGAFNGQNEDEHEREKEKENEQNKIMIMIWFCVYVCWCIRVIIARYCYI